jgi:hypothetical protein
MLESKYRRSEAAVADRAKMLYEYVDSSIAIYRPNLKLFLIKMISEQSSTKYELRKHFLRSLCFNG